MARRHNRKVLGKPRQNLSEFGQLLLVRVKCNNKLEETSRLGIMAGTYPDIPNGVIVLSVDEILSKKRRLHTSPRQLSVIRIDGSLNGTVLILTVNIC